MAALSHRLLAHVVTTITVSTVIAVTSGCTSSQTPRKPATSSATAPPAPTTVANAEPRWRKLFDGRTLEGWQVADFAGHGDVEVREGTLVLETGAGLTGVTWQAGDLPTTNYEITLEAQRASGRDFFCGLTFPAGDSFASLIVGGWGGGVVGISSIDGEDAAANETTSHRKFETGRWYRVRLRVRPERVQAWIDDERVVDLATAGKRLDVRADIDQSRPLGLASWRTTAKFRDIRLRILAPNE